MTAPLILPAGYGLSPVARTLKLGQDALEKRAGDQMLKLTASLFAGDHWAGGAGWTGPLPFGSTDQLTTLIVTEVERTFVSRNLARDVVERHRNGIAGREPLWNLVPRRGLKKGEKPTAEEQARIDEYSAAITDWWDENGAWPAVQAALDTALWSGAGHLRLFISAHDLDELDPDEQGRPRRGIRTGTTLSEAMRRIQVHAPAWNQAGVVRDRDDRIVGAVHSWQDEQGQTHWEVHERSGQSTVLHPDLLGGGTDAEGSPPVTYPVPGLFLYELRLPRIITDSIQRLSKFVNKTLTMGSRNIDLGGFTETTILNAQRPEGRFEPDPDAPGGKRWKRAENHLKGAGAVNYINGFEKFRVDPETGKKVTDGVTTPSVIYKDPTPFQVFQDSLNTARMLIYDEARQLHVLITGDATANGISRQQAVNDFLSSLEPTRIQLEHLLRWLLDTVLRAALFLIGQTDAAKDLRVRVQARTSAVQPTPAEVDTAIKLHEKGLISEEEAMQRVGTEDVEASRTTRQAEGITPALAFRILESAPAWIGVRALMLAFPALGLTDQDVAAHRELDLAVMPSPVDSAVLDDENADDVVE